MFCENCGHKLGVNHVFCEECGAKVNYNVNLDEKKSNTSKTIWIVIICIYKENDDCRKNNKYCIYQTPIEKV